MEPNYIRPGADPWVIEFNGKYYWSQSNNPAQSICVWESETPDNPGERHTIWRAPRRGPYSRELWAPEIHHYNGRFYVLFAADDGQNKNHRTYVLVSESDDPFSKYELHGPVYTGDSEDGQSDNHWAIDSTIFPYKGKFYLIWSGWEDDQDVQYLYIAPLKENLTETAGPRVKICHNADYLWERVEERLGTRGLAEGPEILEAPNGRIFLTYSCGASWLPTYKIGMLELVGDDPTKPESWKKFDKPWFQSDEFQFGVGHGSFIRDKDGQTRYVYHAKTDRNGGWGDRAVFWRYVDFDEDGTPSIRY
ncbi:MAG: glycoside hydrolase family 43 protein [Thermoguttaceae bacterium]|nr:glycoside hydrolase family 43 protein [Thermoguttaceae bacterium]